MSEGSEDDYVPEGHSCRREYQDSSSIHRFTLHGYVWERENYDLESSPTTLVKLISVHIHKIYHTVALLWYFHSSVIKIHCIICSEAIHTVQFFCFFDLVLGAMHITILYQSDPIFSFPLAAEIEDEYEGPRLEEGMVTENFMLELMEHYKAQKKLHRRYAYKVVLCWVLGSTVLCVYIQTFILHTVTHSHYFSLWCEGNRSQRQIRDDDEEINIKWMIMMMISYC